ncbi:MAG: hybrid sensor histidine kinase/response regulator, partial [Planctomycetes bacterium]|nr:hybrid sensor histidine kinase/response regulator [Planctomycetota bacterium]
MDVLSILVVEDEDFDAAALFRQLDRALPIAPNVHRAGTLAEASSLVGHGSFDVAFLDLCLPDGQSEACLEWLQEAAQKMPVIVLTGLPDDLLATSALRKGAQDYLVKERMDPTAVMRSLRFAVERYRLQHELVAARTRESQLRDRLLSHVSHELRTPLTAIVQFGAILRDGIA